MGIEILNFGENWFLIESTFVIVEFLEGSYGRKWPVHESFDTIFES